MHEQKREILDGQQLHALARRQRSAAIGKICVLAIRSVLRPLFGYDNAFSRDT